MNDRQRYAVEGRIEKSSWALRQLSTTLSFPLYEVHIPKLIEQDLWCFASMVIRSKATLFCLSFSFQWNGHNLITSHITHKSI